MSHSASTMLLLLTLIATLSINVVSSQAPGRMLPRGAPEPDPSLYRNMETSRGMDYHYYLSESKDNKPYLLFLHGFPCTSYDWRYQIAFFGDQGYGLVVPDMLGYGGTSKPVDPEEYKSSLLTKDLVEILDAEGIENVVVIGHDWYVYQCTFGTISLMISSYAGVPKLPVDWLIGFRTVSWVLLFFSLVISLRAFQAISRHCSSR